MRSVYFSTLILICLSSQVIAGEGKSIDQMIHSLKFEKIQAEIMINKMAQSGRINKEEASRAKRAIASVQEESLEEMKNEAMEDLKSSNSVATK